MGDNNLTEVVSTLESFEPTKREKALLARLSNFFQACSTHGGEYVFVGGPISDDVCKRNMQASLEIAEEAERLNREQGYNDPTIWN